MGQGNIYKPNQQSSSLGSLISMYNQGSKMFGDTSSRGSASPSSSGGDDAPSLGVDTNVIPSGSDALSRKISEMQQQPSYKLAQGLSLADDPNLPLDYETRMAVATPMLMAKHGVSGDPSEDKTGGDGEGSIKSGKGDKSNSGLIGSIISLL